MLKLSLVVVFIRKLYVCMLIITNLQVNVSNIGNIVQELFQENIVRGR